MTTAELGEQFISHHGVKGMHWGVRKAREVSPGRQAKREAKAEKFVKKSVDLQRQIETLQALPKQTRVQKFVQGDRNKHIGVLAKEKARADVDAERKRQGKLSTTQKHVIVGAAVVATLVAGGVLATQINSGEARQLANRGREIVTGQKFEFTKAPELKGNWNAESIQSLVVKDINRGYPDGIGSGMNCRRCTFAYEMRRRGYDVAATRTPTASGQNPMGLYNVLTTEREDVPTGARGINRLRKGMMEELTEGRIKDPATRHISTIAKRSGNLRSFQTPEYIFQRLMQEPDRSRGELGVQWKAGGGHSMAYEIIDGVPHVFDTQTGKYYDKAYEFFKDMPQMESAGFTRLDNVNLDTHFLQRWLKNAK
jgi:hypothetical protein